MSFRDLPAFRDLRSFVRFLDERDDLVRIDEPVNLVQEMTWLDHAYDSGGEARMPVLANLSARRIASRPGLESISPAFENSEKLLAALREPAPVDGLKGALSRWPMVRAALATRPQLVARPDCQAERWLRNDINLLGLPIQTCWPGEPLRVRIAAKPGARAAPPLFPREAPIALRQSLA